MLGNHILAYFQKRCKHPDDMVAMDILEGVHLDTEIAYCRRCGAVRLSFSEFSSSGNLISKRVQDWRLPDPFLWKGYKKDQLELTPKLK